MRVSLLQAAALSAAALAGFPGRAPAEPASLPGQPRWWDALPRPVYRTLERVEIPDPWFEVYRIRPGVFAIYEPGHFEEALAYLIVGTREAVLFDTCLGIGNIKAVVDRLTDRPILVVNSHTHPDHIGGNRQFDQIAVADVPFARERLAAGMPDLSRLITPESVWKALPPGFDPKRYRIDPITPTRWLKDGDAIDLGDRRLEVIATPGHTPDSLCVLDRANRILFTGDTFYPATLYAHTPDADFEAYLASADRLAALVPDLDIVCPGHNEARTDPAWLTDMATAFRAVRDGTAAPASERDGVARYEIGRIQVLLRQNR